MGFINGTGPEGSPVFNNTPQTVTDLSRLRDLVIERGNRFKGTTTQRDAWTLTGAAAEGQEWFDTTLNTALIRRGGTWKRDVSFRTFAFARSGMSDNTMFYQVLTEDAAKDTEPAFTYAYNAADGKITPESGIYMLTAKAHPGGAATGASVLQLRGSAQGLLTRGGAVINGDPWMACSALFRADGTEGFFTEIQKQTGGASNGSGVLNIAKLTNL